MTIENIYKNNLSLLIDMNTLSNRLNSLSPSATLAMSQKSAELKAQGVDVINLSVGEPDFNTPDHIKEAAKKAIDDNFSRYSPVAGYPALRNAIVAKLKNENGLEYTAAQISCANGAKQSVCNTILALVNPGDEVIVPAPFWVSYPEMVKLAEGCPVIVPAGIEQDFKITPAQLEAAITPKTRVLILCSPSNPTGSVYSREELAGLVAVLANHPQIMVVADEIYEHINYIGKHQSIAQFPEMKERTVIVNGVSKAYAMTGWRIGFIAGPEWIVKAVNKLQGQYTSGPCSVSQKAAEAAYTGRADASGLRASPRPDCEAGQRGAGLRGERAAGCLLPLPQMQQLLRQAGRRPPHPDIGRPGHVSTGGGPRGLRGRHFVRRTRVHPHELRHQRREHRGGYPPHQGSLGAAEIILEQEFFFTID